MELSTESAHANDFEDYVEPFEDEGMSEEEEDYLDYLLGDENEQIQDPDEVWQPPEVYMSSQSSLESMSSMGEPTPTSVYWKDDNVKDEGAPDPRTVQFRPGRKPGIHLRRLSQQTLKSLNTPINFFRLFLTNMLVTSLCIATNQHAEFLIRNGNFKSYARSDGTWERVAEAEMEKFIGILIYMSFMKLSSLDRYCSTDPLYRFNPISSCMTSLRFKAILAFLQITPLPDVDKGKISYSGVKHSDFKSTCIPSFNENSKRLRCTFCYAHAKLNELPETHCKTLFHCGNCNVNLCFSPDRDCFTKWHSTEGARVRAWVKENGRNKDH